MKSVWCWSISWRAILQPAIWSLEGRGKSGGARVIYFFHNASMPLFALTAFAKNQRADLSQADRNDFKRLTALLVRSYEGKGR